MYNMLITNNFKIFQWFPPFVLQMNKGNKVYIGYEYVRLEFLDNSLETAHNLDSTPICSFR